IDILISKYIFNFIKNLQTTDNKKLEEYISTPRFVNNSLRIELKSSLEYYKFASDSISNIDIQSDFISLLNITLLPTPIASSESCFTWSGNTITGLTSLGRQQNNLVLPKRANALTTNAFVDCNFTSIDMSLSNITHLPRGDGSYNNSLFCNCRKLETVILPYNLVEIGWRTFYSCEKLNNLAIPDTVISLDREYLFGACSSLSNIILPKQMSGNIGNFAFLGCRQLKTINIPEGIVGLNWASFLDCSGLVSINLPNSLRIIDKGAFERCTSLETVNLNNNLQTIGTYAFYDCKNLREIRIPNSVTSIGTNAFNTGGGALPNLVIYVNSTNVQNLVKKVFTGTVILN
ncbi:MAG: leucine-rich repeat domain-containing protein, partial [Ureaplasma sp.]|nr:leucine-rich repeat domain-containing protein [Ureaplasma sp.]